MDRRIRRWKLSDAKDLSAILSSGRIQQGLRDGVPYPYTEQDAVRYISAVLSADTDRIFALAITVDGKVAGSIEAVRQRDVHRLTAELGYYIAEEHWGKGLVTEAVEQICGYIFDNTDILRIYAEPFAFNSASCRVLEKAGFQYEGTLRSNAVKNGEVTDMKMYSILRPEVRPPV